MVGDEFQDWVDEYYESVVHPQTEVHKAPAFLTGTAKPGVFEDFFNFTTDKMNSGDRDYRSIKWTIEDGLREGEVTQEEFDRLRAFYSGKRQHIWDSEYMLDFSGYAKGRVFSKTVAQIRKNGQVGFYGPQTSMMVDTFWDVGINGTTVWFRQNHAGGWKYLKYMEELEDANFDKFCYEKYIPYVNKERIRIRYNIFPHDMEERQYVGDFRPRVQLADELLPGKSFTLFAVKDLTNVISHTQKKMESCVFSADGCRDGISRLNRFNYLGKKVAKDRKDPNHHAADAFMLSCVYSGSPLDRRTKVGAYAPGKEGFDKPRIMEYDREDLADRKYAINRGMIRSRTKRGWSV